jgi:hypothetical protein
MEDDFLNEKQLNDFLRTITGSKLNIPFQAARKHCNYFTLYEYKETIETILQKKAAWIRWSGVFGLYKMQKQSIIKDVENLLNSER